MKRTALSLSSRPDRTAEIILGLALSPEQTKAAILDLQAAKADHDARREKADLACQALASEQARLDDYKAKLDGKAGVATARQAEADARWAEAGIIIAGNKDQADRLASYETALTQRADDLVSRETSVGARESRADSREADIASRQAQAQALIDEYAAKLAQLRTLAGA